MLRANPPPPFSMLYKKEANSRDGKFNIEKGGGGSIVEIRKEICLKYLKMTKCLNTFVTHCSPKKRTLPQLAIQRGVMKFLVVWVYEVQHYCKTCLPATIGSSFSTYIHRSLCAPVMLNSY